MENRNGTVKLCGAKKHQGEGTCRHEAGWGTKHPGVGPCKLHGGCAAGQVGADNPNFKHGLYSKYLTDKETIEFDEFAQRAECSHLSVEEKFQFYRAWQSLARPGPIPPLARLTAVDIVSRVKCRYYQTLNGTTVNLRLGDELSRAIVMAVVKIVEEYVPEDKVPEAMNRLEELVTSECRGLATDTSVAIDN